MEKNNSEKNKMLDAMKSAKQIIELMHDKKNAKNINEYKELDNLFQNNKYSEILIERLLNSENYILDESSKYIDIKKLEQKINKQKNRSRFIRISSIVAVAAAVISISFLLYIKDIKPAINQKISLSIDQKINKPTIILSSGENIKLDTDSVVEVEKYLTNIIPNLGNKKEIVTTAKDVKYNTIIVPDKYTLNVVLSDGTEVSLNANSELRYPAEFSGNNREVFLKGEGFFNVVKNEKPFIVAADEIFVTVYGTKFNVNTNKSNSVETILLSGSVGVKLKNTNFEEVVIKPNQSVLFDKRVNTLIVKDVDADMEINWMGDFLICHNESFVELIEKMSSWYGAKFELSDTLNKDLKVTISLNKHIPIEQMIKHIENTIEVIFTEKSNGKFYVE